MNEWLKAMGSEGSTSKSSKQLHWAEMVIGFCGINQNMQEEEEESELNKQQIRIDMVIGI